jgi:DNA-binding MarR family transcriptional regulator
LSLATFTSTAIGSPISTLSTLADGGPRRIADLAAIQRVAQPSMTEMVATLERAGYVQPHRDPLDGRASLASLTAAGRDFLRDRRRTASQSLARLVAKLPAPERASLNAAVPALVPLRELSTEAPRSVGRLRHLGPGSPGALTGALSNALRGHPPRAEQANTAAVVEGFEKDLAIA